MKEKRGIEEKSYIYFIHLTSTVSNNLLIFQIIALL